MVPLAGGLGGEFVISTESETSGTIVLRHEMGHNFVNVGEGYDGGSAYRGANFDSSRTNIKWAHFLTDQTSQTPVEEPRKLALQDYPWQVRALKTTRRCISLIHRTSHIRAS